MKYFFSVLVCFSIVLLSVSFYNVLSKPSDEPQVMDHMNIDDLKKQIREYINNHEFEPIVQALPDNLIFDIYCETKDSQWVLVKVHSLIRLGRKKEACELMEKFVMQPMDESVLAGMFYFKYAIDCLNDNYGNATVSITNFIEWSEKSTELSKNETFIFLCYTLRADVYAARRMHKEAEDDLAKLQELRGQYPSIFLSDTPGEYMLRKYLEDPEEKSFHRVEMPLAKADPTKGSFTVNWWCCGLSEEDQNEYYRLFVEPQLQTAE